MGESCLIHSLHGKSRASSVLVAYLMKKYGWSMNKALQLLQSKKQGLEVRQNYLKQVQELEKRLAQGKQLSQNWLESKDGEDLLLANTFKNSKKMEGVTTGVKKNCKKKLTWD